MIGMIAASSRIRRMEVYFEGFQVYYDDKTTHDTVSNMDDIDIVSSLCYTAKHSFSFLTTSSFHKVGLKHHTTMSIGEKEYSINILFQVWKSSPNEDIFYQSLVSRICLSHKVARMMNELLQDMTAQNEVS